MLKLLRSDFEKEVGPYKLRKSSVLYEGWVEAAGGIIKGAVRQQPPSTMAASGGGTAPMEVEEGAAAPRPPQEELGEEDDETIVPLWLLKQSNDEQVSRLFSLLCKQPAVIHWYLEKITFPTFMMHQERKLSASGQELGGAMLFSRRIGFSGTPSDLLPLDLGQCGYEKGSDGKMIQVLTSPDVMRCEFASPGWTVETLLQYIAEAEPRFHALIDTGALITGLSNEDVARKLLSCGLGRWCEGVVFLDESDEKVIGGKARTLSLPCTSAAPPLRLPPGYPRQGDGARPQALAVRHRRREALRLLRPGSDPAPLPRTSLASYLHLTCIFTLPSAIRSTPPAWTSSTPSMRGRC